MNAPLLITPAVRTLRPLGSLDAMGRDPLRFLVQTCETHGDVVRFRLGPVRTFLLRHPAAVKHVLVDHRTNYDKQTHGWKMMRSWLGDGLLTSEGDFWKRQRRIAQPAFHRARIASFGTSMVALTEQMLTRWETLSRLGKGVDMVHEMNALALRIVAKTLLDTDVESVIEPVSDAVTTINEAAQQLTGSPLIALLPIKNRKVNRSAATLDEVVMRFIAQRRRKGPDHDAGDLLSMLMNTRDADTGETMSDRQLRDEVLTIFLAGHETTANALAWTLKLLSENPTVEREVHAELQRELGDRPATTDDLPRLDLLPRVIKESLRLYPPAWMLDRRCVADDVVMGHRIPAGSLIIIAPWVTHRDPRLWPNPRGFDPDRFLPELDKARPRWAYFPFGGGPRLCIGKSFAHMEMQLVLATILRRFRANLVPGHVVKPAPLITLRPSPALVMDLHRR